MVKVFLEFEDDGCMKLLFYYNCIVDVVEELVKFILFICDNKDFLVDCYFECVESVEEVSKCVN